MMAIIIVFAISSILASVLVITASMLSSRLSRVEDHFLVDEIEVNHTPSEASVSEPPPPTL